MILLIDNYDSFVHNLARYIRELSYTTQVVRNDVISLAGIAELNPTHIIISPGPCDPNKAGISMATIKHFAAKIPILGVCLGHQAIGQVYGGKIVRAQRAIHGKNSLITHDEQGIFLNLENPLLVGRYHSLIVSEQQFPTDLMICARSKEGEIMALRHRVYPIYGVQFHPESVLTQEGYSLLQNFLMQPSIDQNR